MNRFRKIASFFLAFVMMFGTAVQLVKAEETGTITVKNTIKDATYKAYRILDLESYDPVNKHYVYRINSDFEAYLNDANVNKYTYIDENGETKTQKFIDVDAAGYVTEVNTPHPFDAQAFAQSIAAWATTKVGNPERDRVSPVDTKTATTDNELIKFEGLTLGAYIITSTVTTGAPTNKSLVSLTTTNPNAEVVEKNEKAKVDKVIRETDGTKKANDTNIGDTVKFESTIEVKGTLDRLVYHDTMSKGLSYDKVTRVTVLRPTGNNDAEGNPEYAPTVIYQIEIKDDQDNITQNAINNSGEYYVYSSAGKEDGCTFELDFATGLASKKIVSGDKILIEYEAAVNENAVIAGVGNPNEAKIEFKNEWEKDDHEDTSETKTYTWKFDIEKFEKKSDMERIMLAGAEFSLYRVNPDTNPNAEPIKFVDLTPAEESEEAADPAMVLRVAKAGETNTVTTFTTNKNGEIELKGLDSGTYYLKEIKAPAGYNILKNAIEVQIIATAGSDGTTLTYTIKQDGEKTSAVGVENKYGTELPGTGGIGTTMFYTVGGALVLGAAVLLITKKRAKAE